MDYKTVMVGLALDRPNDACLRVAGDIAERFGARIIGVAASDLRPPMYFADGDFAQKLLDEESRRHSRSDCRELEAEFRASVEKRATAVEWRSARALPVPYMLQQARAADILVVGARTEALVDPGAQLRSERSGDAGGTATHRRAILGGVARFEKRCWWPGRTSGSTPGRIRCVADSGCCKGNHDCGNSRAGRPSRGSIVACCRHGGMAARPRHRGEHCRSRKGRRRDRTTRKIAANIGAGRVIAGAYGHSRLREWVLSGVTRHLATESRRCAFLSR